MTEEQECMTCSEVLDEQYVLSCGNCGGATCSNCLVLGDGKMTEDVCSTCYERVEGSTP